MHAEDYRPQPLAPLKHAVLAALLMVATGTATGNDELDGTLSATPAPEHQLEPFSATFRASLDKGVAIDGSATRTLVQLDSGLWRYEFKVDAFIADIDEYVIFRWENNRVLPLQYRYELSGMLIPDRERNIKFDWNQGIASGEYEGKSFSLELRDGSLDPLGYQLQLHQDLRAGLTDVTYQVVDKGRYDVDRFAVINEEQLETKLGEIPTVVVEKVRDADSRRETLMWFAPQWDHLMVRLTQREPDGSAYEIHIEDSTLNQD